MKKNNLFYLLDPHHECEPGWYKLKWKPIWNHTICGYWHRERSFCLGINFFRNDEARNGWGRSYQQAEFSLSVFYWSFRSWIKWDVCCMATGPQDVGIQWPIDLSKMKRRNKCNTVFK